MSTWLLTFTTKSYEECIPRGDEPEGFHRLWPVLLDGCTLERVDWDYWIVRRNGYHIGRIERTAL